MSLDGYTLHETLGQGFSAKVKRAERDGQGFAIKIFDKSSKFWNEQGFNLTRAEHEATECLDHPNIVKYYEFRDSANKVSNGKSKDVAYLVQELVTGGELFDYVANAGAFTEAECKYFFKQMLKGLDHIHSNGFSHRDLKPENILLDANYNIKIVDFGFIKALDGQDGSGFQTTLVGTKGYQAPEILAQNNYQGQDVDLFALGVILFILYSGHPPFSIADPREAYYSLISKHKEAEFWQQHQQLKGDQSFYSDEFKSLMTLMFQKDTYLRPSMADIIAHPWMAGGVPAATQEEIQAEFTRRQQINKERAQEERAAKDQQRQQNNRRDFALDNTVYLTQDETVAEEAKKEDTTYITLELKEYVERQNQTHQFFSTYLPGDIMAQLNETLSVNKIAFTMSNKTWRMNSVITKENKEIEGEEERCDMQIEIYKVKDQEKYCVDFQRKAGSAILFYDNANLVISELNMLNNTTLNE